MTPEQAWHQLLEIVEQSVPRRDGGGQPRKQIQWLRSNGLVLSGQWPVQARFVAELGKYSIYFERFGADIGNQNFELPPGFGSPKTIAWTMLLEISGEEAFWRFSDGRILTSTDLARRVLDRVPDFQREYAMSVIAPAC
jgi:hypothetical protein